MMRLKIKEPPMTSKEVIAILEADGWQQIKGKKTGHRHYKHDHKPGKVTVPFQHGDLSPIVIKGVERQSGLKIRR
jgi:predicted RNA binding protein YcfA (HicA-like mRNA interferase family)